MAVITVFATLILLVRTNWVRQCTWRSSEGTASTGRRMELPFSDTVRYLSAPRKTARGPTLFLGDRSLDDRHRPLGHSGDAPGHAAEQASILAGAILRSDHRQVDVGLVRVLQDFCVRVATSDDGRRVDVRRFGSRGNRFDRLAAGLFECGREALELVDLLVTGIGTVRPDAGDEAEAGQQLRAQIALIRVHRTHEDEIVWMPDRDALAFDHVLAHGRGVEQHVDDVVIEEVHQVDVHQVPVGLVEDAGVEPPVALLDGRLEVDGFDDAVRRAVHRQIEDADRPLGSREVLARRPAGDIVHTLTLGVLGGQS